MWRVRFTTEATIYNCELRAAPEAMVYSIDSYAHVWERCIVGGKCVGDKQVVWMTHGDEAVKVSNRFQVAVKVSNRFQVALSAAIGLRAIRYVREVEVLGRFVALGNDKGCSWYHRAIKRHYWRDAWNLSDRFKHCDFVQNKVLDEIGVGVASHVSFIHCLDLTMIGTKNVNNAAALRYAMEQLCMASTDADNRHQPQRSHNDHSMDRLPTGANIREQHIIHESQHDKVGTNVTLMSNAQPNSDMIPEDALRRYPK
ncbi:hypothetical protein Tco_0570389, partial [Tanacetum coccineum]